MSVYQKLGFLENMPGAMIAFHESRDGEFIYANADALQLLECGSIGELNLYCKGCFYNLVPEADSDKKQYYHVKYHIITKNGKVLAVEENGKQVSLDGIPVYVAHLTVGEQREDKDLRDGITGLYTRLSFLQVAGAYINNRIEWDNHRQQAILYFDVRKFKMYNMHHGFEAGNTCLEAIGQILRYEFKTELVGRFSDDHFVVFAENDSLDPIIDAVHDKVYQMNRPFRLWIDVGVYRLCENVSILQACDFAKMACDSIENDETKYKSFYSETIAKEQAFRKYVVDNLDFALENGNIKIYYQPVIRTLTGKVCGMEALTRWKDPERGMMSPGRFIPILEESNLIYKLDSYVVEEVAKHLRQMKDAGEEVIPISLNISQNDFVMFDPYQKVVEVVEKNRLLREWICIEITESAIAENSEMLKYEIAKFRDGGFEVWMDDFGSGYSSLNALKDYPVDEIKFDMIFLRNINDRAKQIMTSVVSMAKKLGIHTLAEGVESLEQMEFLRKIGCEKVQGYLYSPPMPYDEMITELEKQDCRRENREERAFYAQVGKVNLVSDNSLALVLDNQKLFKILYMNRNFWKRAGAGSSEILRELEIILNGDNSFLRSAIRTLAERAEMTGKKEKMDYAYGGRYYRLSFECVAKARFGAMLKTSLADITMNENKEQLTRFNAFTRSIINLYDLISVLDYKEHTVEIYMSKGLRRSFNKAHFEGNPGNCIVEPQNILPEEREAFNRFFDLDFAKQELGKKEGKLGAYFSVKGPDGNFRKTEFSLCLLSMKDQEKMLLLQKAVADSPVLSMAGCSAETADVRIGDTGEPDHMYWMDLMRNTDIYFFWKDKNRRFLGASQSFLDYYGFESIEEIQGKTDEEIKWHIDDEYFRNDEELIIQKGISVHNVPGQNLVGGVIHNILATKFPTYKDGKINGLMGYFIDAEKMIPDESELQRSSFVDMQTGLMNTRGFMMGLIQFEDNYRLSGEEYWLIVLEVEAYREIFRDFGKDVAEDMVKLVSEVLKSRYNVGAALSRISSDCLVILEKNTDREAMEKRSQECIREIMEIREVDGYKCTLYVNHNIMQGAAYSSAAQIMELIYAAHPADDIEIKMEEQK